MEARLDRSLQRREHEGAALGIELAVDHVHPRRAVDPVADARRRSLTLEPLDPVIEEPGLATQRPLELLGCALACSIGQPRLLGDERVGGLRGHRRHDSCEDIDVRGADGARGDRLFQRGHLREQAGALDRRARLAIGDPAVLPQQAAPVHRSPSGGDRLGTSHDRRLDRRQPAPHDADRVARLAQDGGVGALEIELSQHLECGERGCIHADSVADGSNVCSIDPMCTLASGIRATWGGRDGAVPDDPDVSAT